MTAEELTAWRKARNLTKGEAADDLGVGRRSWGQYEAGLAPVPKVLALASMAVDLNERLGRLREAAQAVLNAYGGDTPDWIRVQLAALEEATNG